MRSELTVWIPPNSLVFEPIFFDWMNRIPNRD